MDKPLRFTGKTNQWLSKTSILKCILQMFKHINNFEYLWFSLNLSKILPKFEFFRKNENLIFLSSKKWKFEKFSNWDISMSFCSNWLRVGAFESLGPILYNCARYDHVWARCDNIQSYTYMLTLSTFSLPSRLYSGL